MDSAASNNTEVKSLVSDTKTVPTKSRKERREEYWKNKKSTNDTRHDTEKTESTINHSAEKGQKQDLTSPRKKLRNRDSIAKPDSLKYEPNLNRGFHSKIIENLYKDTSNKNKKSTDGSKAQHNSPSKNKRKNTSTEKASPKKMKVHSEENPAFDSSSFSLKLINGQDDSTKTESAKDSNKKYVLFIGNLPFDVTKEQLEEHFRISRGIKTIRIPTPKGSKQGRGFAYMEFDSRISHGMALRLHQTTLGGRKINVEFTSIGGGNSKARKDKLQQKNKKRWKKLSSFDQEEEKRSQLKS